jgi:DNA-binding transcriptional LysR family regulator
VLLMRTDHRLASLAELRLEDLVGERLIFFERAVIPQLYDGVMAACRKTGFTPNFVYETQQSQVGIAMVSEGVGAMLGAAYIFNALPAGLTTRPFNDMDQLTVQLFWRSGEADPLIHEFLDLAQEEARRLQIHFQAQV